MENKNYILSLPNLNMDLFAAPSTNFSLDQLQGSNLKELLVVSLEQDHAENNTFLNKIFSAAKFNLEEDALLLLSTKDKPFSFVAMKNKVAIRYAVFFGVSPQQFGLNFDFKLYQNFNHQNTVFLFADDLSRISANKNLKAALWNSLKEMFSIGN